MIGASAPSLAPLLNCWEVRRSGDSGPHEMSDIDGFGLPGFDTGVRKLRASGTVPASNMLLALQTQRSPRRAMHQYSIPFVDPEISSELLARLVLDCMEHP